MNFPPGFTKQAAFLAFKKAINRESALEVVFHLFEHCHNQKSREIEIPDEFAGEILALPPGVDPLAAKTALISTGMISPVSGKDRFRVDVYVQNNQGLFKAREGGKMGGRPSKQEGPQKPAAEVMSQPTVADPQRTLHSNSKTTSPEKLEEDVPF